MPAHATVRTHVLDGTHTPLDAFGSLPVCGCTLRATTTCHLRAWLYQFLHSTLTRYLPAHCCGSAFTNSSTLPYPFRRFRRAILLPASCYLPAHHQPTGSRLPPPHTLYSYPLPVCGLRRGYRVPLKATPRVRARVPYCRTRSFRGSATPPYCTSHAPRCLRRGAALLVALLRMTSPAPPRMNATPRLVRMHKRVRTAAAERA